jgi:hypothetical protein
LSLTHLKRLIGSTYHSNSTLSGNLWLSNKVFKNKNFIKLNRLVSDSLSNKNALAFNLSSNLNISALNASESSIM